MPYLHWDTSEFLACRDQVVECRRKAQYYQEEMSKLQAQASREEEQFLCDKRPRVPNPFPEASTSPDKTAEEKKSGKEVVQYVKDRMDFERRIQAYLKQQTRRHQLLYNYAIVSKTWDGALHPMRSLLQYGRPFAEDPYYRRDVKDQAKQQPESKHSGRDILDFETAAEEVKPEWERHFEAQTTVKRQDRNKDAANAHEVKAGTPDGPAREDQQSREVPKSLMVNQLWLWAINSSTI